MRIDLGDIDPLAFAIIISLVDGSLPFGYHLGSGIFKMYGRNPVHYETKWS